MNYVLRLIALGSFSVAVAGCGGSQSGAGPLTPLGAKCPVGPPGKCQLESKRSDEQRFDGLNELAKRLLDSDHPLRNSTLAGGEEGDAIGDHVRSVAIMMSAWHLETSKGDPSATRRQTGGDLHSLAQRIRCAADKLIELGPSAPESELVCWCQELWRTSSAYSRMGPQ